MININDVIEYHKRKLTPDSMPANRMRGLSLEQRTEEWFHADTVRLLESIYINKKIGDIDSQQNK